LLCCIAFPFREQTKTNRAQGKQPSRWHWVYMATVFRLDHRGQTAGQRTITSQRGHGATRFNGPPWSAPPPAPVGAAAGSHMPMI